MAKRCWSPFESCLKTWAPSPQPAAFCWGHPPTMAAVQPLWQVGAAAGTPGQGALRATQVLFGFGSDRPSGRPSAQLPEGRWRPALSPGGMCLRNEWNVQGFGQELIPYGQALLGPPGPISHLFPS